MKVTEFKRSDLLLIDCLCAEANEEGQELLADGELANAICPPRGVTYFASDYDGPAGYGNRSTDWNVLIPKADLDAWVRAAERYGVVVRVVSTDPPADGHYGDGAWMGVDLVSVPTFDDRVYWIER